MYHGVVLQTLEGAIFANADRLIQSSPPAGIEQERIAAESANVEDAIEAAVKKQREIARAPHLRRLTPAERQLEVELYAEQERLEQRRRQLAVELAAVASPMVEGRLNRLSAALAKGPQDDFAALNGVMRETFATVVVDYRADAMKLSFRWRHGGESSLRYG